MMNDIVEHTYSSMGVVDVVDIRPVGHTHVDWLSRRGHFVATLWLAGLEDCASASTNLDTVTRARFERREGAIPPVTRIVLRETKLRLVLVVASVSTFQIRSSNAQGQAGGVGMRQPCPAGVERDGLWQRDGGTCEVWGGVGAGSRMGVMAMG